MGNIDSLFAGDSEGVPEAPQEARDDGGSRTAPAVSLFGGIGEMFDAVNAVAHEKRSKQSKLRRKIRRKLRRRLARPEGAEVNGKHQQLVLCYALGVGMRTALCEDRGQQQQQQQPPSPHAALDDDGSRTLVFRPEGSSTTPPHELNHVFKLKVYAPSKYKTIRQHFGVSDEALIESICGVDGDPRLVELKSNARSGAFIYCTNNGRFVLKTMTKAESHFLNDQLLDAYVGHIARNPKSLLTRFLGSFRLKLHHLQAHVYFVVMGAIFNLRDETKYVFDLKGSSLGRSARPGEKVSKDNDLRAAKKLHDESPSDPGAFAIELGGPAAKAAFLAQASRDADFLQAHNVIDYSLMLGVVDDKDDEGAAAGVADAAAAASVGAAGREAEDLRSAEPTPAPVVRCEMVVGGGGFSCFGGYGGVRSRGRSRSDPADAGSCTEDEDGNLRIRLSRPNSRKFRRAPKRVEVQPPPPPPPPPPHLDPWIQHASESENEGGRAAESESEGVFHEDDDEEDEEEDEGGGDDQDVDEDVLPAPLEPISAVAPLRMSSAAKDRRCFFGIIDILGTEQMKRVNLQQIYKSTILGHDRLSISCVDSKTYRDRFIKFLEDNTAE
jgi:hypothetical protein